MTLNLHQGCRCCQCMEGVAQSRLRAMSSMCWGQCQLWCNVGCIISTPLTARVHARSYRMLFDGVWFMQTYPSIPWVSITPQSLIAYNQLVSHSISHRHRTNTFLVHYALYIVCTRGRRECQSIVTVSPSSSWNKVNNNNNNNNVYMALQVSKTIPTSYGTCQIVPPRLIGPVLSSRMRTSWHILCQILEYQRKNLHKTNTYSLRHKRADFHPSSTIITEVIRQLVCIAHASCKIDK